MVDSAGSDDEDVTRLRDRDGRGGSRKKKPEPTKPVTITVQLSGGVVVIRRLKCGLLFVCIGPPIASSEHSQSNTASDSHHPQLTQHQDTSTPPDPNYLAPSSAAVLVGSPSADSLASTGGQTNASLESVGAAGAATMRRHAAELARWLDDKLGSLSVPEEGVGIYH
jgi:hypothetical protein